MSRAHRPPGVLACFGTVALMALLPRVAGFRRTLRVARALAGAAPAGNATGGSRGSGPAPGAARASANPSDTMLTARTAHRVALAAAFYPRRALCLEQSLALYVLLRRRGVPAVLRLGVQPRPFYAHAWVEAFGQPVNEEGDLPARLATFTALEV
jgi:hypothetical protein